MKMNEVFLLREIKTQFSHLEWMDMEFFLNRVGEKIDQYFDPWNDDREDWVRKKDEILSKFKDRGLVREADLTPEEIDFIIQTYKMINRDSYGKTAMIKKLKDFKHGRGATRG